MDAVVTIKTTVGELDALREALARDLDVSRDMVRSLPAGKDKSAARAAMTKVEGLLDKLGR